MKSNSYIITQQYSSPCGDLLLGTYDGMLCICDWTKSARHDLSCRRLTRTLKTNMVEGSSPLLTETCQQLDAYFAGKLQEFTLPLMRIGTAFQKRVWSAIEMIPFAETMSYSELSKAVGHPQAVRAVASNVGNNPHSIIVPCHRIIGSNRSLTGYAGGLETKQYLLALEASCL